LGPRSGSVFAAATAVYLLHTEGDVDGAYRLLTRALDDAGTARTPIWLIGGWAGRVGFAEAP
jgi:hypothetical protein